MSLHPRAERRYRWFLDAENWFFVACVVGALLLVVAGFVSIATP